jgi:hypothetical protein
VFIATFHCDVPSRRGGLDDKTAWRYPGRSSELWEGGIEVQLGDEAIHAV